MSQTEQALRPGGLALRPVTFVCGGRNVPSARFRVDPVAAGLRTRGWQPTVVYGYGTLDRAITATPLRQAYRAACRARRAVKTALLSDSGPNVLQRLALPWTAWPELAAKRRGAQLVFDFDDAIFLDARQRPSPLRKSALNRIFDAADRVVAGNSWLASFVPDPGKVTLLPTCIDVDAYRPPPSRHAGPPVIGWMGTVTNLRHLRMLVEPVAALRREGHRFRFVVVSDVEDKDLCRALGATFVPWSAADELAQLQSFDIGVMPLANEDWCRGKCGFKLIQYMAVASAVVGSAVGFNCDVVRDGVDGFLVDEAGWFEALRALVTDPDRSRLMGAAGRGRVESTFPIARAADTYDRLLRTLQ